MGSMEDGQATDHPVVDRLPSSSGENLAFRQSDGQFWRPLVFRQTKPVVSKALPQFHRQQTVFDALGRILAKRDERLADLPPSIRFLSRHGVPTARLEAAHKRSRLIGVDAHEVLIASGVISESEYCDRLAAETGCRRVDMSEAFDECEPIAAILDHTMAWQAHDVTGQIQVLVPTLRTIDWLLSGGGASTLRIATKSDFERLLIAERKAAIVDEACHLRLARRGRLSAKVGVSARQAVAVFALGGFLTICSSIAPKETFTIVALFLSLVFIVGNCLQCAALFVHRAKPQLMAALSDAELPVYTVLVALYNETPIVPNLLKALLAIDYPPEKLDIKLILEANDETTRRAIETSSLPSQFSVVICPPGDLQTKPRAMNIALLFARGTLVAVFDAEDIPKRDQLRLAACRFHLAPRNVGCLQAALTLYNDDKGLMPAMFALEYAALFDVTRSGWCRLGLPMPLGGTSNHFRLETLSALGAWDAYNVTEDAELGLRLGRLGYAIETLPSTTGEQAPVTFPSWFNQRRRWSKGWLQTTITLTHDPVGSVRAHGFRSFALGLFIMASTLLNLLLYPVGMLAFFYRISYGDAFFSGSLAAKLSDAAAVLVVASSVGLAYVTALIAIAKRNLKGGLICLPLIPFYYLAISAASWVALGDLWRRPFYWLKTEHGAYEPMEAVLTTPIKAANDNRARIHGPSPTKPEWRLFARNRYSVPISPDRQTGPFRIATKAKS